MVAQRRIEEGVCGKAEPDCPVSGEQLLVNFTLLQDQSPLVWSFSFVPRAAAPEDFIK